MVELLDIVGQDSAIAALERAIGGGRVPHAFLFAGPQGVGRRTTAEALAKVLLCEAPQTRLRKDLPAGRLGELDEEFPLRLPCGHCHACRMMGSGSHPDCHMVYKELARYHEDSSVRDRVMQELSIDVIKSFLIAPAYRSAATAGGKVFIVRQADLMSVAAQNALLKTLEEPPPGVKIILLCERPQEMLPTTLSRCRIVHFHLLPRDFVAGKLVAAGVDAQQADFWAAFTGGSIGMSLELSAVGMYEVKQQILDRLGRLPAGGDAELADFLVKATDTLADASVKAVKQSQGAELSRSLASRTAAGRMLEIIASAYVDALHQAGGAQNLPMVHRDQAQAVAEIAGRFSPTQLAEIIEQLSEYEQLLWRNVNAKIVWDNVVVTCGSAAPLQL